MNIAAIDQMLTQPHRRYVRRTANDTDMASSRRHSLEGDTAGS